MSIKFFENRNVNLARSFPYAVLALIIICMILTGCDLTEPTRLTENRVQVEETKFSDTVPVEDLNDVALNGLAEHYRKHGDGPLELTVTYDPQSRSHNAMHASAMAADLSKEMRKLGVTSVSSGILPVKDAGSQMNAMISYTAYNAHAPKDCSSMSGLKDNDLKVEADYKLGCTIDTVFAKQIARPKDLKGVETPASTFDGRRLTNSVERYRSGIPNEPLEGERASE